MLLRIVLAVMAVWILIAIFQRTGDRGYADPVEPYRATLEELAQFQTAFHQEHGRYSALPVGDGFEAKERYVQTAVHTQDRGWAGGVRRRGQPGWGCVYKTSGYTEELSTPGGKPSNAYDVVCDDGPPPGSPLER